MMIHIGLRSRTISMQMGFKYKYCNGFGRMYNYGLKHFNPNTMITKEAETRLKILNYWKKYGLKATRDTFVRFDWNIKRYIITAVDVHSRYAFAFCYDRALSINAKDFIKKLQKIFPYKIKAIQTDNGSEFHKYFKEYLKENNIIHYWNYPGKPFRQGHIEKFNRTIQEEFVDWNYVLLEDTNRFNEKMGNWINWYNTKRFHWGLNLETPVDYLINNGYVVQYVVN